MTRLKLADHPFFPTLGSTQLLLSPVLGSGTTPAARLQLGMIRELWVLSGGDWLGVGHMTQTWPIRVPHCLVPGFPVLRQALSRGLWGSMAFCVWDLALALDT